MIEACFEVAELHGNDLIEGQDEDDFRQLLKVAVVAACDWSYGLRKHVCISIEDRPAAFKAGGGRFSFAACFLYRWECFYRISRWNGPLFFWKMSHFARQKKKCQKLRHVDGLDFSNCCRLLRNCIFGVFRWLVMYFYSVKEICVKKTYLVSTFEEKYLL